MVAILNCTVVPKLIPNAFLWLYDLKNTHVALPEKDNSTKYSIWCYLNISTPVGFKIENISFVTCNDGFLYLYKEANSHVSKNKGDIGLCFASPFDRIIKAIWSSDNLDYTFVLGLYKEENSHVSVEKNNLNLYFVLSDNEKPSTEITFPTNNSIITSTIFSVSFRDYDNAGLLCFYEINGKVFERKCNSTVYVNAYECEDPCIIKTIVVDFAGNEDEKIYVYKLKNVPLLIQIEAPERVTSPISNPIASFKIRIANPLNEEVNLSITYTIRALGNVPEALLPKINISNENIIIKPAESKEITVTVIGYKIGDYLITFNFKWKDFETNKTVLYTISPVLAKKTISVFEKILLPILYLI